MKILILSPIPSHPASNVDRFYLQKLGATLKRDGSEITFVLCCGQKPSPAALEAMEQYWDNFLYLGTDAEPDNLDKAKITDAVRLMAPVDLDLFIANYAFIYPDYDHLPKTAIRACLPNLYDPVYGCDVITRKQSKWFSQRQPFYQSDLFAKTDLLLARNEKEAQLLDQLAICPVARLPLACASSRRPDVAARLDDLTIDPGPLYTALNDKRKRVLLVTDRQFWDVRHAISSVLIPLFRYLQKRFHLTVYYLGSFTKDEWDKVWELGFYDFVRSSDTPSDFHIELNLDENAGFKHAFARFIQENPRFDAVIFNFIMISYLADCIPYRTLKILDTQDIMAVRRYSMEKWLTYDMPLERETAIYNSFDATLFIEQSERDFANGAAPETISIYCPASYEAETPPFPSRGMHFGFVGSQWILNSEAIEWFLENVWPFQNRADARLHIFGGVCKCLSGVPDNVVLHGIVPSAREMFSFCNVVLNPTLRGSGFPTKSLQALAHGRPLLATEKGARGLVAIPENGIFAARNRSEHIEGMLRFSNDPAMRTEYSRNALAYAKKCFTADPCYADLVDLIDSH